MKRIDKKKNKLSVFLRRINTYITKNNPKLTIDRHEQQSKIYHILRYLENLKFLNLL